MKYCEKCGQILEPGYMFCSACGTKQKRLTNKSKNIPESIFLKYAHLSVKGVYGNVLEFTSIGIHMYRSKSIWSKYDIIIPYSDILGIEYVKPTIINNGYFSILTRNGGIAGMRPPFSMRDTDLICHDPNTLFIRRSKRTVIEEVYNAINDIIYQLADPQATQDDYSFSDFYSQSNDFESSDITIMNDVDSMEGHQFEYFCADLLKKNGFINVNVTPGSGDQGVDILAEKDGVRYAIQCKNYASALGNTPVQEVSAGKTFYRCHVAVVLTNSTFTDGAKTLANATGVLLWDRNKLRSLIETIQENFAE